MRKTEIARWCKIFLLIAMPVIVLWSCKNNEEVNADYVGTWSAQVTVADDANSIQCKDKITFTPSGFSDLIQVYNPSTDKYIDYQKLNGTMSVNNSILNLKVSEIGISTFDVTGYPTGSIIMYKEGSNVFDLLFLQTDKTPTFKSEYSVSGNQLTLKTDNNLDGDYTDAGETTVYTKE